MRKAANSDVSRCCGLQVGAGRRGDAWVREGLGPEFSMESKEHGLAKEKKDLEAVVLHFLVSVASTALSDKSSAPMTGLQGSKSRSLSHSHRVPGSM